MPPPAIMLTKVKSADEVRLLDDLLSGDHSAVRLHVIIETNDGLNAAYDIAQCCDRIDSLLFGGVDMAADLRVEPVFRFVRPVGMVHIRHYTTRSRKTPGPASPTARNPDKLACALFVC